MIIKPSTRKDTRFMAIFKNGTITHFGAKNGNTYIDHGDKKKRLAYIARHSKNGENWRDPYSAGALSRFILWGDYSLIDGNVAKYNRDFNV